MHCNALSRNGAVSAFYGDFLNGNCVSSMVGSNLGKSWFQTRQCTNLQQWEGRGAFMGSTGPILSNVTLRTVAFTWCSLSGSVRSPVSKLTTFPGLRWMQRDIGNQKRKGNPLYPQLANILYVSPCKCVSLETKRRCIETRVVFGQPVSWLAADQSVSRSDRLTGCSE